jgi:nucleoside-diphosphate-sugar epimerase
VRVLITGGHGFVGSHLSEELTGRGHEVTACGREDGDLTRAGVAEQLLERHVPDTVVHLAAAVGRAAGERDPVELARQNAGATALVARACAVAGVRLACGSSTEVYGSTGEKPAREDEPLVSALQSLYGLSKRWGEEAALFYCPDAVLLRLSLPYGPGVVPGQGSGAIVNMLDQALHGRPIPAYRDTVRSWCWVGDAVRGVALVLESGRGGAWNVGRDDDPRSMVEVAALACRLAGAPESLIEETDPPGPAGAAHRVSMEKLRGLGWAPEVGLEQGMRATLASLVSPG